MIKELKSINEDILNKNMMSLLENNIFCAIRVNKKFIRFLNPVFAFHINKLKENTIEKKAIKLCNDIFENSKNLYVNEDSPFPFAISRTLRNLKYLKNPNILHNHVKITECILDIVPTWATFIPKTKEMYQKHTGALCFHNPKLASKYHTLLNWEEYTDHILTYCDIPDIELIQQIKTNTLRSFIHFKPNLINNHLLKLDKQAIYNNTLHLVNKNITKLEAVKEHLNWERDSLQIIQNVDNILIDFPNKINWEKYTKEIISSQRKAALKYPEKLNWEEDITYIIRFLPELLVTHTHKFNFKKHGHIIKKYQKDIETFSKLTHSK